MSDTEHMPAWLVAKADQRASKIQQALGLVNWPENSVPPIIQAMLTDPPEDTDEALLAWDTTCDCCGAARPEGFKVRHISCALPNGKVVLTVGACPKCWDAP